MPIKKEQSTLPKTSPTRSGPWRDVEDAERIVPPAVESWWKDYSSTEDFDKPMAIEDREYRASWSWMRCDRGLWYLINKEEQSEPDTPANHWRMAIGSMGHELLQDHLVRTLGGNVDEDVWVAMEEPVDLRPIGLNGAATADAVRIGIMDYDGDRPMVAPFEVIEIKTINGFGFKKAATGFKGQPEGPKWGHVVQGSLAAAALGVRLRIVYLSLELVGPDIATKLGLDDVGKFAKEWIIEATDAKTIALAEVARVNAVLADPFVSQRYIWDPDLVEQPMMVSDPSRGAVIGVDHQTFDRTWICGYCPFRSRCLADG